MPRCTNKIWLSIAALFVVVLPLGSTGAPGLDGVEALHAGALDGGARLGGTVTDLHLIAFSRDIINH